MANYTPEEFGYNAEAALQDRKLATDQSIYAGRMLGEQQITQAALIEQINPAKTLIEIRALLSGKILDDEGNIISEDEPLVNAKGLGSITLTLKSVVNINTIMSALDDKEISKLMLNLMDDIVDDLTLNWKEYGITDKINLDRIHDIIVNMVYPTFKRAKEGGERRFLGKVTVENIQTNPKLPQMRKESFLSRFKL